MRFLAALLIAGVGPAFAGPKVLSPLQFKNQLEMMEVFATHLESYTLDGVSQLEREASELIYAAGHMQPTPKDENAAIWCTLAAQSLRNFLDDVRKGPAGASSARAEMVDFRDYKPKCLKALKNG